jgi:hypothetical protein
VALGQITASVLILNGKSRGWRGGQPCRLRARDDLVKFEQLG